MAIPFHWDNGRAPLSLSPFLTWAIASSTCLRGFVMLCFNQFLLTDGNLPQSCPKLPLLLASDMPVCKRTKQSGRPLRAARPIVALATDLTLLLAKDVPKRARTKRKGEPPKGARPLARLSADDPLADPNCPGLGGVERLRVARRQCGGGVVDGGAKRRLNHAVVARNGGGGVVDARRESSD